MLRKPGPRVRFAHFWPFSCIHCGTRPEHSPQSLRFYIVLRVGAFGLAGSWDGHCRRPSWLLLSHSAWEIGQSFQRRLPAIFSRIISIRSRRDCVTHGAGGFLWRSSAVKWEAHRASHACMRKPGGSPISVRGLFEHRGNPCPFGCPSIYSHSVTLLMSGVGMQPPSHLPQLEFMTGKKKRRRAMFLRMGLRLSS